MSFLFSSSESETAPLKLSPVKSNIEEANKHIQALCERVAQLETERDAVIDQLEQERAEFQSLKRSLEQCQERLSHRDIQTKNFELTAASREEIILELESHLVAHQRDSQAKSEALNSLEILLAEKETVFERISEKVSEYQKLLDVKNRLLEAATENAAKLEGENALWRQKENDLREKLTIVEEENIRLKKDKELKESKSVVALEKILAYSSSIEDLVGTLREASKMTAEGEKEKEDAEDVDETSETEDIVELSNDVAKVESDGDGDGDDDRMERCEVRMNGWKEAITDEAHREDSLPEAAGERRSCDSSLHSPDDVSSNVTESLVIGIADDLVTPCENVPPENAIEASQPSLDSSQSESSRPLFGIPTKESPVEDRTLSNSREAQGRIRGQDRIAGSILLFDSPETANANVSTAEEAVDNVENGEISAEPSQASQNDDVEEETDRFAGVGGVSQSTITNKVATNGFYENDAYSYSDSESSKINSTEFFV